MPKHTPESSPDPLDCLDGEAPSSSSPEAPLRTRPIPSSSRLPSRPYHSAVGPQTIPRRTSPTKKQATGSSPIAHTGNQKGRSLVFIPIDAEDQDHRARTVFGTAKRGPLKQGNGSGSSSSTSGRRGRVQEADSGSEGSSASGSAYNEDRNSDEDEEPPSDEDDYPASRRASLPHKPIPRRPITKAQKGRMSEPGPSRIGKVGRSKHGSSMDEDDDAEVRSPVSMVKRRRIIADDSDEDEQEQEDGKSKLRLEEQSDPNDALRALVGLPSTPAGGFVDEAPGDEGEGVALVHLDPEEATGGLAEVEEDAEEGFRDAETVTTEGVAEDPVVDKTSNEVEIHVGVAPPTPPTTAASQAQAILDQPAVGEDAKERTPPLSAPTTAAEDVPEAPLAGEINAAAPSPPPNTTTAVGKPTLPSHPVDAVPLNEETQEATQEEAAPTESMDVDAEIPPVDSAPPQTLVVDPASAATSARPSPTIDSGSATPTPTPTPTPGPPKQNIDEIIKSLGLSRSQAKAYKEMNQGGSASAGSSKPASSSKGKVAGTKNAKLAPPPPKKKGSVVLDEESVYSPTPPPPPSAKKEKNVSVQAKKGTPVEKENEIRATKPRSEGVSTPARRASASVGPAPNDKEERSLFCICNKPYDEEEEDVMMIGCDQCDDWFHPDCLDIEEDKVASLESFVCHNCSSTGKWQAAWKKLCRREGCGESVSHRPSKFCSSECGMKHAQSLIGGITNPKTLKALKTLLVGYPRPDVPTGVVSHLPTPPTSPTHSSTPPLGSRQKEAMDAQIEAVQTAINLVEKRQAILDEAIARCETLSAAAAAASAEAAAEEAPTAKGKKSKNKTGGGGDDKLCGWEERLIWDDEEVLAWTPTASRRDADGDGDVEMEDAEGEREVCRMPRRRCDRHGGWQKTMMISLDEEARTLARKLANLQEDKTSLERSEEARIAGDNIRKVVREKLDARRASAAAKAK